MHQLEFKVTITINQDNVGLFSDNDISTLLKHDLNHFRPSLGNIELVDNIEIEEI